MSRPLRLCRHAVLANPHVQAAARRLGLSAAQLVLAWQLGHGGAVIPCSTDTVHLRANLAVARITLDQHTAAMLDGLRHMVALCWEGAHAGDGKGGDAQFGARGDTVGAPLSERAHVAQGDPHGIRRLLLGGGAEISAGMGGGGATAVPAANCTMPHIPLYIED